MDSENSDPALAEQPDGAGDVGQRQGGGDHHRGERRLRQVAQQTGHQQQHQGDGERPDQAGDLGLGAGLLGHGGSRAAGAHREPLEEPGGDVGGADPDHLPAAVDLLSASRRERRRGRDRVGERDDGDAERPCEQGAEIRQRNVRNREGGESPRQGADQGDAVRGQIEDAGGEDRNDDRHENAGDLRKPPLDHQDQGQARPVRCRSRQAPFRRSPRLPRIPSTRR